MTSGDTASVQARREWARLMGAGGLQDRTGGVEDAGATAADLPAPEGLTATPGRGQVTLAWDPVPGAIGYAVHRSSNPDGPFAVVDHGGGDVLAVPHGPYADTTGSAGQRYWYAVAPLATVNSIGPLSPPVSCASACDGGGVAEITVDAGARGEPLHRLWRAMVGSEHLSHLLCADLTPDRPGGRVIGAELREALRRARDELGVESVRAHGILCDDLGVVRDGRFDFGGVDRVYDIVRDLGLRPVVELSFMPRELAREPGRTVFAYQGIVSPPRDWDRWGDLVASLTAHLADRHGLQEIVDHWPFEVWNEANLSVFWSGTPQEFWRLYEVSAQAVKSVDPRISVGGPASAAAGWIDGQLAVAAPADFLSTHIYGSPPLDLRPLAGGRPLLWTEWGVTPTHGSEVNDTVFAAAFLLRGMRSAAGRMRALAPWVASDHFEELGRPQRLLHGGFGLLTVGNLAKPKFWALSLAERLGDTQLPVTLDGDGAGSLVECWAARSEAGGNSSGNSGSNSSGNSGWHSSGNSGSNSSGSSGWHSSGNSSGNSGSNSSGNSGSAGTVGILLWNSTLDHGRVHGDPRLDRDLRITVTGLASRDYELSVTRIDASHNNVAATWQRLGGGDWPDARQWRQLAAEDRLVSSPPVMISVARGTVGIPLTLPMPSIAYLRLRPV